MATRQTKIFEKHLRIEDVGDLTSLDDAEADVSCNMQDISLVQLEKEWTEATQRLKPQPKLNNFTAGDAKVTLIEQLPEPIESIEAEDDIAQIC